MATMDTNYATVYRADHEKYSTFLYTVGQTGRDIYSTMTFLEEEQDKIDILFSKFESYCKLKQNITIEHYCFNTCVQGRQETYRSIHNGTETHC